MPPIGAFWVEFWLPLYKNLRNHTGIWSLYSQWLIAFTSKPLRSKKDLRLIYSINSKSPVSEDLRSSTSCWAGNLCVSVVDCPGLVLFQSAPPRKHDLSLKQPRVQAGRYSPTAFNQHQLCINDLLHKWIFYTRQSKTENNSTWNDTKTHGWLRDKHRPDKFQPTARGPKINTPGPHGTKYI